MNNNTQANEKQVKENDLLFPEGSEVIYFFEPGEEIKKDEPKIETQSN